jgi:hypothetical protein
MSKLSEDAPRFGKTDRAPWYAQFWVWFLIAIPALAVAGSIATALIASRGADSLVKDDWYREGRSINRTLARDETARRHSISAELRIDAHSGQVAVKLAGDSVDAIEALRLELSHPTLASHDYQARLERAEGSDEFLGQLPPQLRGRWHATLSPDPVSSSGLSEPWRLRDELRLPPATPLRIGHGSP